MARILRGPPLELPDVPAHKYVLSEAAKYGDKLCVIDKGHGRSYTYNEIINLSKKTANGLQNKLGMRKGDIIAFLKTNSADFLCMMYGAFMAGGMVSTLNPASTTHELKHYLAQLKPRYCFTDPQLLSTVREAAKLAEQKFTVIISSAESSTDARDDITMTSLQGHPGIWKEAPWDAQTDKATWPALIPFSSGTTGLPKGVVLSHRNVVAEMVILKDCLPDGEIHIACFPMFHVAGLIDGGFLRLVTGFTQVMYPKFDFEELLKDIETYRPRNLALPPPLVVLFVKSPLVRRYDVSSIAHVMTGAGAMKKETEEEFKDLFGNPFMGQAYGMTETCGATTFKTLQDLPGKSGSVGRVVAAMEAKVVDPESGQLLGPNQSGEICARGPVTMMEYLNNSQATADILDRDGWIHTGDIGYYDDDGYFYIIDRIKDLIKYNAFQVSPAELEAMVLEHPDVADVGVVGVPDKMAGELPRAYVVRQPGRKISAKDIQDFVKERASYYKWLRGGVAFVETIPKLPSGKIMRRILREKEQSRL